MLGSDCFVQGWALQTAPLAVDTNFYRPGPTSNRSPYVLTISHLTRDNVERKRLLDVVRTAAELRKRASQLHLVIVGGYEDGAASVQAEIARLDLHDTVTLVGRISAEEKLRLLQGASVYLQPSQYESFGVASLRRWPAVHPLSAVLSAPSLMSWGMLECSSRLRSCRLKSLTQLSSCSTEAQPCCSKSPNRRALLL